MIYQAWATNLLIEENFLSTEDNKILIDTVLPHVEKYNGIPEIFNKDITIPNLLKESDEIIQKFRNKLKDRMYEMLSVEGFIEPNTLELDVNIFPRTFYKGDRARPHVHRNVDYVGVYYLDLDIEEHQDVCDHDNGKLLLVDPISNRSRGLNHRMVQLITPVPKMLVIHPSYLFHEAEVYKGDKPRFLLVINIKVKDRQQYNSFVTL